MTQKEDSKDDGGATFSGNINTGGGDVIGRDKNIEGDVVQGDSITVGDISGSSGVAIGRGAQANVQQGEVHQGDIYSGDFRGAILNVRSPLSNVTQSIGALPNASDQEKADLKKLVAELELALAEATQKAPDQAEDAEAVAAMTEQLVDQAAAEKPNKALLSITGDGLKKAAENIAAVTPTVLKIATQIVTAVLAFA